MIKAGFLKAQKNELPFHYDYPYEDSDFLFWTFQCIKQKDGDFRDLWRELRACPSPTEKAEMVKNRSKSVTDFLDLMEAGRFFGEGCPALLERLGNGELALLTARLPRHGEANLPAEQEWQEALIAFLKSLPAARRHNIATLSAQISF